MTTTSVHSDDTDYEDAQPVLEPGFGLSGSTGLEHLNPVPVKDFVLPSAVITPSFDELMTPTGGEDDEVFLDQLVAKQNASFSSWMSALCIHLKSQAGYIESLLSDIASYESDVQERLKELEEVKIAKCKLQLDNRVLRDEVDSLRAMYNASYNTQCIDDDFEKLCVPLNPNLLKEEAKAIAARKSPKRRRSARQLSKAVQVPE